MGYKHKPWVLADSTSGNTVFWNCCRMKRTAHPLLQCVCVLGFTLLQQQVQIPEQPVQGSCWQECPHLGNLGTKIRSSPRKADPADNRDWSAFSPAIDLPVLTLPPSFQYQAHLFTVCKTKGNTKEVETSLNKTGKRPGGAAAQGGGTIFTAALKRHGNLRAFTVSSQVLSL